MNKPTTIADKYAAFRSTIEPELAARRRETDWDLGCGTTLLRGEVGVRGSSKPFKRQDHNKGYAFHKKQRPHPWAAGIESRRKKNGQ